MTVRRDRKFSQTPFQSIRVGNQGKQTYLKVFGGAEIQSAGFRLNQFINGGNKIVIPEKRMFCRMLVYEIQNPVKGILGGIVLFVSKQP